MIWDFIRGKFRHLPLLRIFRGRRRERLVRDYFFVSVVLIAGGLISAGLLEIYFRYSEGLEQVHSAQQEAASRAAFQIERFIQDIAATMKAFAKNADLSAPEKEYEFELKRLLFLAPAVTEAMVLDPGGILRAQVSRFRAVAPQLKSDLSQTLAFQQSKQGRTYFGLVYFRDSDPYFTVAVPIERAPGDIVGVLQTETSLRDILDVASAGRLGQAGYRYVITRVGDLIAHSDIRLVSNRSNFASLGQVQAAFQSSPEGTAKPKTIVADNADGQKVFSSHAIIPTLGWAVFVERPAKDAYAPIYASLLRTSILLLIGLGMALLASFLVARRVVRPLRALREGVERIGSGDLNARLDIKTGDEIEILADEFNDMAAHLREAYTGLERKVAERTRALTLANEKLAEANQLKSQFLANVNHELRTPLSAILGYARLLQRETAAQISPLQRENLQDLLNNAERLLHLIDSLLDFARIEAGKMEVRIESVKVDEVIRSAAAIIEPTLHGNVGLAADIASDLPEVNTDREKLRQILVNLLENAAKFTERGEIKIAARRQDGALELAVSDTGIGIEREELDQIFEEFHRAEAPNRKKYPGTGLGLAITKKYVTLLGGEIRAASEVGKGSSFIVTLPLSNRASAAA